MDLPWNTELISVLSTLGVLEARRLDAPRPQQVHEEDRRGAPGRPVAGPRAQPPAGRARASPRGAPRPARRRDPAGPRATRRRAQDSPGPGGRGPREAPPGVRRRPAGPALPRGL